MQFIIFLEMGMMASVGVVIGVGISLPILVYYYNNPVFMSGESADAFLGTQGYVWDTQSDMGLALLGAILSLWLLSALHNSQLRKIQN